MKFVFSQISYFLTEKDARQNIRALLKYMGFLALVIASYSVIFHLIMLHAEGRYHSWVTGIYWTLTVMTTLGFGDITPAGREVLEEQRGLWKELVTAIQRVAGARHA